MNHKAALQGKVKHQSENGIFEKVFAKFPLRGGKKKKKKKQNLICFAKGCSSWSTRGILWVKNSAFVGVEKDEQQHSKVKLENIKNYKMWVNQDI